jgi:hypothetical protein
MARQTREQRRERAREHRRALADARPFCGVDGEGAGTDEHGRQHYLLLRAGSHELYTGAPLSTEECLDFLCDLPDGPIYVGFSFGYDVTMILRDLPGESPGLNRFGAPIPSRRDRLLAPIERGPGKSRFTYWKGFGIEYLPRNYFRVCRLKSVPQLHGMKQLAVPDSSRTIYEVFGFFQKSFATATADFRVGTLSNHATVVQMKAERGSFGWDPTTGLDPEVRRYCGIECDMLAAMMETFRKVCLQAGLRPRTWNGAGKLANVMHSDHGTITAVELETLPAGVRAMARDAYYGGRFEVTRVGRVAPAFEYDIRSAYPAAMGQLPCLRHGRWEEITPAELRKAPPDLLYVAPVRFRHDVPAGTRGNLCGLPIRKAKDGRLIWPAQGQGVYWSPEIRAAAKLGCRIANFGPGWAYVPCCDCKVFDWVEGLYCERIKLGKDLKGYPIKLGLNALYGLLAQRIGTPRFANLIWAGLITALTRARLMEAAALDPDAIAMLATDGILTTRPLDGLDLSERLGAWETKDHPSIFIVQPGLYWGPKPVEEEGSAVSGRSREAANETASKRKLKTRGAAPKYFASRTGEFEAAWAIFAEASQASLKLRGLDPPAVTIALDLFIGLKLAQARGKPLTAGSWPPDQTRSISFDWRDKRGKLEWEAPECGWTYPLPGSPGLASAPHSPRGAVMEGLELLRAELNEEQPDMTDFSPPWV